jgi:hypothetical protein
MDISVDTDFAVLRSNLLQPEAMGPAADRE